MMRRRALLLGFFSTIGDLECLRVVEQWLREDDMEYDVAAYSIEIGAHIPGSIPSNTIDPGAYSHLFVICGPCWPAVFAEQGVDLWAFQHCVRVGVNLTMVEPLSLWNPFDVLLERDSSAASRPDLSFLYPTHRVPVVGTCVIERQDEYGARQRHDQVITQVDALIHDRGIARVAVDTKWPRPRNTGGLACAPEVISLMSRTDVVITNRLHGLVFALKAGVPALVIDGIEDGAKVSRQAATLGWPACQIINHASADSIGRMFDWCRQPEAKDTVCRVRDNALAVLAPIQHELSAALRTMTAGSRVPSNTIRLDPEPRRPVPRSLIHRLKTRLGV